MTVTTAWRALIADDEAHLRDYLEQQLREVWPELRVVARAANGIEALRQIDEQAPDVVFLDIRMPGMTGLDVAAQLLDGPRPPHIVFVTAFDQYAVQAFDHAAVDYLLKPATLDRLGKTVARLKAAQAAQATQGARAAQPARSHQAPAPAAEGVTVAALQALLAQLAATPPAIAAAVAAEPPLQWLRASQGEQVRLIAVDEVVYFQSNDKYTSVMLADGECLIRTPISKLREQLDAGQFWQIHQIGRAHV